VSADVDMSDATAVSSILETDGGPMTDQPTDRTVQIYDDPRSQTPNSEMLSINHNVYMLAVTLPDSLLLHS